MVKMEVPENEILEKLVCRDIPDTMALQQMRLKLIGGGNESENFIKEHYPEKWKIPRVAVMPLEHQKKVYSLSVPLTFGFGEPSVRDDREIQVYFSRWRSGMCGKGALHLTTEENLNMILEIFVKNSLPIKLENSYGSIFGADKMRGHYTPAIAVPFCWYVDTCDPSESLIHHQFAVCKQKVVGTPFYFLEETVVKEEEHKQILSDHLDLSLKRTHRRNSSCSGVFTSPEHCHDLQPDKLIPEILAEKKQRRAANQNPKHGELESAEIKLLRIGEPVLVYDPAWVSEK